MKDFMNNRHPMIKFTFEHSTQEISFLDMKIHIGVDRKLSATLYRKLQTVPHYCTSTPTTNLKEKKALFSCKLLDTTSSLQMTPYRHFSNLTRINYFPINEGFYFL